MALSLFDSLEQTLASCRSFCLTPTGERWFICDLPLLQTATAQQLIRLRPAPHRACIRGSLSHRIPGFGRGALRITALRQHSPESISVTIDSGTRYTLHYNPTTNSYTIPRI